jgi:PAS domain S-box-containing protein
MRSGTNLPGLPAAEVRRPDGPDAGFSRRLGRRLVAAVGMTLAIMWALFAYSTAQQFALARQAAVSDTTTLSKLVEAWTHSTLQRFDFLVASIATHLDFDQSVDHLNLLLARQEAADPDLFVVVEIRDRRNQLLATSDPRFPQQSARNFDSDLAPSTNSVIGLPRRVGNQVLIPVLHPLHAEDGTPTGSIVAEIDPRYFAGFNANLGLPESASIILLRADGPLLARNIDALGAIGGSYRNTPLWSAFADAPAGSFEAVEADGTRRVVSYRSSTDFPLVVSIGYSSDHVFAEAWRHALSTGLIGLVLSALIIVATLMLVRQLRRRAVAEAAAETARAAVQSVGNGVAVVMLDVDRRIALVNPALCRLLDCTAAQLEGTHLRDPRVADTLGLCAGADWPDLASVEAVREVPRFSINGFTTWVEIRSAPIRDRHGLARHAVLVVTEVTERKHAERELVEAKEVAEASSRAKTDFLTNMSHELRTPLNAIIGFSEIIARELFGPLENDRYREYADCIHTSGSHLLEIISDILDLAKIEANRIVLDEEAVDVADILAMCTTLVAGRADTAGVTVRSEIDPELPALRADSLRLKQIVLNLLSNAVKFSPDGGEVVMRATARRGRGIEIAVVDRGCGMTGPQIDLAMQPFRQVNGLIAKNKEGTGLGLPLACRLMRLHGGSIVIDSAPGRGTVAQACFPDERSVARRSAA